MRQQLFDYVIPVAPPPPRLQPNIFAKIARTSYAHATGVILMWLAICAAVLSATIFNPQKSARATLEFSGADFAARNLGIFNGQFPNLNGLMTITIRNPDPQHLKLVRLSLVSELERETSGFALVLAPGAGEYYQDHAIFYYSLDEVKARVDYALSLKPLFAAVAESPTTESLAKLVNEVSASITLGRDPQGIDTFFNESAKAVKSLMEGNDRHVDWSQIADLNFDPESKEAVILALPKLGLNQKAESNARVVIAKLTKSPGTEISLHQAKPAETKQPSAENSARAFPFFALAIIFVGFVLFAVLGRFNFARMIVAPVLVSEIIDYGILNIAYADQLPKLWPVFLGLAIFGLQIASRLAFAMLETFAVAVSPQSAVMLAFQKQGPGVVWLASLAILVWCGWFAISQAPFALLATIIVLSLLASLCATLTLIPAFAKLLPGAMNWRAGDWFLPIYQTLFANRTWRILRKYLAMIAVVAACAGLFFSSRLLSTSTLQVDRNQTINVLVRSKAEAEAVVQKLSTIREAQSVRWLGAFLPKQSVEKLQVLQGLQNQFPRFKPLSPQEPQALRDQITSLLVSLEEIATSQAATPEIQDSANNFRRSLEILSNTTNNAEVLEFENRIFGALNLLADHANALASLDLPTLETLDPKLKSLFVSAQNIFRLEVTPIKGATPVSLAHKLAENGLAVAHPALQADSSRQVLLATSAMVLGAILLLGLMALVFAIREVSGSIAGLVTCFVAVCSVFGVAELLKIELSQSALLQATSLLATILVIVATSFLKRQITDYPPPDASHAAEAWLPTMTVAAIAAPAGLLNFTPWAQDIGFFAISLTVLTCVIALFLRPLTIALRRLGF